MSSGKTTKDVMRELAALDPGRLVVMERIGDAVLLEPGARLLHGVAVLDAVDRGGLGHGYSQFIVLRDDHALIQLADCFCARSAMRMT